MRKIQTKTMIPIVIIGLIAVLIYYYRDVMINIYNYLDFYFCAFLVTAIREFNLGNIEMGVLCIIIQIIMYIMAFILFKVAVIDTYFPRFRVVTPNKDVFKFCRKIIQTTGEDKRYVYFRVKFHAFPILRWHKLKIPKPKYVRRGIPFINRKTMEIPNGFENVHWRRMPATLDIVTEDMHLNFDPVEQCYILGMKVDVYREDPVTPYEKMAYDEIQTIGQNIIESVKGDYGMIKDQFHMGIVIREKDLPIPDVAKHARPEVFRKIEIAEKKDFSKNIVIKRKKDNE